METGTGTGADFGVKIVEAFQRVDQFLVCPFARLGILRRQRDSDVYGRLRHNMWWEKWAFRFAAQGGDVYIILYVWASVWASRG